MNKKIIWIDFDETLISINLHHYIENLYKIKKKRNFFIKLIAFFFSVDLRRYNINNKIFLEIVKKIEVDKFKNIRLIKFADRMKKRGYHINILSNSPKYIVEYVLKNKDYNIICPTIIFSLPFIRFHKYFYLYFNSFINKNVIHFNNNEKEFYGKVRFNILVNDNLFTIRNLPKKI